MVFHAGIVWPAILFITDRSKAFSCDCHRPNYGQYKTHFYLAPPGGPRGNQIKSRTNDQSTDLGGTVDSHPPGLWGKMLAHGSLAANQNRI